ncbi:MAG: hypothetical protein EP297_02125 [Gammaproteobacteria bacterium]|nr:MAG: hypothetical protein EP297_02125 [Gammaproteobacteria bacterium]
MEITVFIPGLHGFSEEIPADNLHQQALPALSRLLSKSSRSKHLFNDPESWLYQQFTGDDLSPDQIPVAPITALADGLEVANQYWLRADPVYLYPDTHSLVIQRTDNLELSEDEHRSLLILLKPFIEETGAMFFAPNPQRWYLRLDEEPGISCHPPHHILGKPINEFLPVGSGQREWRVLFNEIQMLLNQCDVNMERDSRRQVPVNSLWFWGGGYMPDIRKPVFAKMISDHPLSSALCQLSGIEHASIKDIQSLHVDQQTVYILDDRLFTAIRLDDARGWLSHLQEIEHNIMQPLLTGLEQRKIKSVTLLTDQGDQYVCQNADLRRFWRRLRPFSAWHMQ